MYSWKAYRQSGIDDAFGVVDGSSTCVRDDVELTSADMSSSSAYEEEDDDFNLNKGGVVVSVDNEKEVL